MNDNNSNKNTTQKGGQLRTTLVSLLVTLVLGFILFYIELPALNLRDPGFYSFFGTLCVIYVICAFLLSGKKMLDGGSDPKVKIQVWIRFIRQQCMPVGILFIVIVAGAVVGQIISMPVFRANDYRNLLEVETGSFAEDIEQVSFDKIPTLDHRSADFLADRQMGTLSDMVSQFEYSWDSTQINYQGAPVRVAPIAYADTFKWFINRGEGLPAYVVVDMVTQEANVVRLDEGIKYSFSEPLNRNINRHLRFQYPTYMFGTPEFELNDDGEPYWIAPRLVKTIGLFGGTDVQGAVIVNAITGESQYHEEVPTWVDSLYNPNLLLQQYTYYGKYVNGFFNSILGQRDVTMPTTGFNYIAIDDDVYVYTGVTSVNSDQSNLGFLLFNQRTKDTTFYTAPGATEVAAQRSAEGVVQDLQYQATIPLLLNIADQPTYFIPLKDATELVKMYAMVNVAQYQIVATGNTVAEAERMYIELLDDRGIVQPETLPQTTATGVVEEIRTAVLEGDTYYFLRLAGNEVFYSIAATTNQQVVLLNVGDTVAIEYAVPNEEEASSILDIYTFEITDRATAPTSGSTPPFVVGPIPDISASVTTTPDSVNPTAS